MTRAGARANRANRSGSGDEGDDVVSLRRLSPFTTPACTLLSGTDAERRYWIDCAIPPDDRDLGAASHLAGCYCCISRILLLIFCILQCL